jgi:Conserved hypothetical protein 2217 (DUF2460)
VSPEDSPQPPPTPSSSPRRTASGERLQSVLLALSRLPDDVRWAALSALEAHEVARLAHTWEGWARDDQLPPATTASGTPWRTVDHATGIVTFLAGHIPASGAAITAGFEFDVPVRFDSDRLEINVQGVHHGAIPSIPIVEIRL